MRILTDESIPEIISFVTSNIVQKRRHPNENAAIIEVKGTPARSIAECFSFVKLHGDPFYTITVPSIFTEEDIVVAQWNATMT
jgi:hypothetical protein